MDEYNSSFFIENLIFFNLILFFGCKACWIFIDTIIPTFELLLYSDKNWIKISILLISPPQKNLEVETWNEEERNEENIDKNIDLNSIKENLEKLL